MAFLVEDFEDFLRLLGQNPEWQQRLRRILLDDFMAEVRDALLDLSRGQAATETQVQSLASRVESLTGQVQSLADQVQSLTGQVQSLADQVQSLTGQVQSLADQVQSLTGQVQSLADRVQSLTAELHRFSQATDARLHNIENDLAHLKGSDLERWYREKASGVFGHVLDRVKVVSFADLPEVRAARKSGLLTEVDWRELRGLDLIIDGILDADGGRLLIPLEISWAVDGNDLARADRRAAVLRRAGLRAMPAVGTFVVHRSIPALAEEAGIILFERGDVVFWPDRIAG